MRRLIPLLAFVSLAFAPVPLYRPKAKQDALKQIQGVWHARSLMIHGRPSSFALGFKAVVTSDRWQFFIPAMFGIPMRQAGDYELTVCSSAPHKSFELRVKGKPDIPVRGIWKVEGDELTICYGSFGAPAPTDFVSGPPGHSLWVFTREKS